MKLYYTKGACSVAPRIILNELNLNCNYISVDLQSKKTEHGDDFLLINPKGAVPVLETDEGEIITENAVIQQYLADRFHGTQLLPPIGNFKRYRVLEWLNYVSTEMHKSFGLLFNPLADQQIKEKLIIPLIHTKLKFINTRLKDYRYLTGDEFTLPDAYAYVVLGWLPFFKMNLSEWPHVVQYMNEIRTRPAVQKSLKDEKLI